MNLASLIGFAIMIGSEMATLARVEPFWSWNTPICWTGFILFADGVVFRASERSWLRTAPREFAILSGLSIPLWLVFEFYNLHIRNWYYTGLPEALPLRLFGYAWAFATIWPAIFEGAELTAVLARPCGPAECARPSRSGPSGPPRSDDGKHPSAGAAGHHGLPALPGLMSVGAGIVMLLCPFFVPPTLARYLAAPVWLGFIFLLDPINAWNGGPSLLADVRAGSFQRTINLLASGLLCGFLWEFWNFWAGAKWHYTVPILEHVKVFEMPVPGYLGFPAFALECFTMYVFVRSSAARTRCIFPLGTI